MRIFALGDVCLAGEPEIVLGKSSEHHILSGADSLLDPHTITIANLECALTDKGSPKPYKWATLRASPKSIPALSRLNLAILGNNHISDFGDDGVWDTCHHLRLVGTEVQGYGQNLAKAMEPAVITCGETRLAVVSLCCLTTNGENYATHSSPGVVPLGVHLLQQTVTAARDKGDAVLVYLHWGVEQSHYPVADQLRLARRAIDYGADAVIGCHAHTIQGYEQYNGKWIFYGIGNFIFGPVQTQSISPTGAIVYGRQEQSLANRQSLVIEMSLDITRLQRLQLVEVHPFLCDDDYIPRPVPHESLTINLGRLNYNIASYAACHRSSLSQKNEPLFNAMLRNGVVAFNYGSRPVNESSLGQQFLRRLFRIWQRISRKLRGWLDHS